MFLGSGLLNPKRAALDWAFGETGLAGARVDTTENWTSTGDDLFLAAHDNLKDSD